MRKIELLSPAGDLERLKYAIDYGADAVYVGGKKLSLRSAASNFTLEDIKEGALYAHKFNKKIYVTCNIVMHESDTKDILSYLLDLEKAGVDAVIVSSFYLVKLVKENTKMEAHLSTQQSISNTSGVIFAKNAGADRVVLARECSLEHIQNICSKSPIDIEVFVEGAMCASVSGRCMLSNIMTNRDANRGGCAQSCRWNYDIYQNKNKVSIGDTDFAMSSKDLSVIELVPKLIEANVSSLKIEGRMKSLHYIATVVNAYRAAIDEYYKNHKIKDITEIKKSLSKGQNREISSGFFKGDVTFNEVIYNHNRGSASHDFLGIVKNYDKENCVAEIEVRNIFYGHRDIEILTPFSKPFSIHIDDLYNKDDEIIEVANHAGEIIRIKVEQEVRPNDLVR